MPDQSTGLAYTVGGTVSGLSGAGLTLELDGKSDVTVTKNGAFEFTATVASGTSISVVVKQQPTMPAQTCAVTTPTTIATANISDISVVCTTNGFTIGGSVTGLVGMGLVLENNDTDDLAVVKDGAFTFATSVTSGTVFTVSIKTQPTGQSCRVVGGSGTVASADVTSVVVTCAAGQYVVGGTVSGLVGAGLVLENNSADDLIIGANGSFAFPTTVSAGGMYAVTVKAQPIAPSQTCTVGSDKGNVSSSDVTTVTVTCVTNNYTVGGVVSGLLGSGLVLQDNLGDNLSVSANGAFTFATAVASGSKYAVTVLTQPTSPSQNCMVVAGSNTIAGSNVGNVVVTCTTTAFTISAKVQGLTGTGLVLQDNGGDNLPVSMNGTPTFKTSVMSGQTFNVSILTQPSGQNCSVSGAMGTVGGGNVSSVLVNCGVGQYSIGGTVTGLAGTGLSLKLNNGSALQVTSNGSFAFPTTLATGVMYTVTLASQPSGPTQNCVLGGASSTVMTSNVTSVTVTCMTKTYSVSVTVKGVAGSGLVLKDNGGNPLSVSADGTYPFTTKIPSGNTYAVTIGTQPTTPWQTCVVSNGSGRIASANVTSPSVLCTTDTHTITVNVSGLNGTVELADNATDTLTVSSNASFTFTNKVASGSKYNITVPTQPSSPVAQTCTVKTDQMGTVAGSDISDINVVCTTNTYTISGTISALSGSGLVLEDQFGTPVTIDDDTIGSTDVKFTFADSVPSDVDYAISVKTQPTSPTQSCSVTGNKGTVGAQDVTGIVVNCSTTSFAVGGSVAGLVGSGLVLEDNLDTTDQVTLGGSGMMGAVTFGFMKTVASGNPYSVTVVTQPTTPWQACTLDASPAPSGTVGASDVSVGVTCVTNSYPVNIVIGGTDGLVGTGLELNNGGDDLFPLPTDTSYPDYTFATKVLSGTQYNVTVLTQPSNPVQDCEVVSGKATMKNGVTLAVNCTTTLYDVDVKVTGQTPSTSLVLQDNNGDDLTLTGDGSYHFATGLQQGAAYAVTVKTQPMDELCSVVYNGSGTIGTSAVTAQVVCLGAFSTTSFPLTVGSGAMGGIALDYSGNVLLLDTPAAGSPTIYSVARVDDTPTKMGSYAALTAHATSLANDTTLASYIVGADDGKVYSLSQDGMNTVAMLFDTGGGAGSVTSVAIAPAAFRQDTVFATNTNSTSIWSYTTDATLTKFATATTDTWGSIAFSGSKLYAADYTAGTLVQLTPAAAQTAFETVVANGLTVDTIDARVYVAQPTVLEWYAFAGGAATALAGPFMFPSVPASLPIIYDDYSSIIYSSDTGGMGYSLNSVATP